MSTSIALLAAAGAVCAPPPGFVDIPAPQVAPVERLVSRVEEIVIRRPLAVVIAADNVPLEEAVGASRDLPHVSGTYNLTPGEFGRPGSRRITCLSDGSTVVEQVLVDDRARTRKEFRYVVWNYTTRQARPIHYAVGQFLHTERPDGTTHVRWTYSFQLRRDRFPGFLGPLGDFLFRVVFLDRAYAQMMQATLQGGRARAEAM